MLLRLMKVACLPGWWIRIISQSISKMDTLWLERGHFNWDVSTGQFVEVPLIDEKVILTDLQNQLPEGILVTQIVDLGDDCLEAQIKMGEFCL